MESGASELRRVDPVNGEVLVSAAMPGGAVISGLEWDGDRFCCGGFDRGKVRAVRRP